MEGKTTLLKNGRIIDPANGIDTVADLLIENHTISKVNPDSLPDQVETIDITGKLVFPGFIDIHVHLREPGEEYKETIQSGAQAAAAGGFTAVACMPNTQPVLDSEQGIALVMHKAKNALIRVYPVGAISKASHGESLADFGEMQKAGAVAFSDDGRPVADSQLMRRAMEYASNYKATIISHSEELSLSRNGTMNEGTTSTRLGLIGIPRVAEEIMVYRDISLAGYTGHNMHLAHVSTKESVSLIRRAKENGIPVTAETAPHYFSLTEEAIGRYDTYAKMSPPLRSQEDLLAIKQGLQDGTIDVIATDHAPHSDMEKMVEFDQAANGIIGLETAIPLTLKLVKEGVIDFTRMAELMSVNPAKILGVPGGTLANGTPADITVIDPEKAFTYERQTVVSKSTNSPFLGWDFTGKAVLTMVGGNIVYNDI